MLNFLVSLQSGLVVEDDVALLTFVAAFVLEVIVVLSLSPGRESFLTNFTDELASLHLIKKFAVYFLSSFNRSVDLLRAESVSQMSSQLGIKCKSLTAADAFNWCRNVVITIEMNL